MKTLVKNQSYARARMGALVLLPALLSVSVAARQGTMGLAPPPAPLVPMEDVDITVTRIQPAGSLVELDADFELGDVATAVAFYCQQNAGLPLDPQDLLESIAVGAMEGIVIVGEVEYTYVVDSEGNIQKICEIVTELLLQEDDSGSPIKVRIPAQMSV